MLPHLSSYSKGSSTVLEVLSNQHYRCRLVAQKDSPDVVENAGGEAHKESAYIDGECELMPGAAWDAIDAQAEREAEAIAWLRDELGVKVQRNIPYFEMLITEKVVSTYRAQRAALRRAMDRINECAKRGEPWAFKGKKEIRIREDQRRQERRKLTRRQLLLQLEQVQERFVRRHVAIRLTGMGRRTLDTQVSKKNVAILKAGKYCMISVSDLKKYLRQKAA